MQTPIPLIAQTNDPTGRQTRSGLQSNVLPHNHHMNAITKQRMKHSIHRNKMTEDETRCSLNSGSGWKIQCPAKLEKLLFNHLPASECTIPAKDKATPEIFIHTGFQALQERYTSLPEHANSYFEQLDYPLPAEYISLCKPFSHTVGIIASDALVMVIDKYRFGYRKLPTEWYELLHPELYRSIALCRGEHNCYDAQFFPFIKAGGEEAVKQLICNTTANASPEEMLMSIENGNLLGAAVYIMPYSYAMNITDSLNYKIIWPADGYIPVPVSISIKKGNLTKYEHQTDMLYSPEFAVELSKAGLISLYTSAPICRFDWMQWDLIRSNALPDIISRATHLLR